jgi:16S rRNA (adenine1518-N6/adenine1519-N6)-dimethyltransferase
MNPSEIKAVLSQFGSGANKRLGQHFLIDAKALEVIVSSAHIRETDRVLEVGPGLGVLTRALLEKGADVIAIEQDRRMIEYLSNQPETGVSKLQIVHGDAATIHWHSLIGEGNWKFVANLPYSITSLALRKALWAPHPPEVAVVLVQREVAERAVCVADGTKQGKTSLLSLMVALACSSAKIVRRVPPGAFYPPPKVDSAVLQLIPMSWAERRERWGIEPEKIMEVAKRGFAHPRKFLASNLGTPDARIALQNMGLSEKIRSEDLRPEAWAELALKLSTQ